MSEQEAEGTIGWFIDTVLLGDLRRMILDCQLHYLGFGVMASGIEFLGACMDAHPINEDGHSKARFNAAIRGLFDSRYVAYIDNRDPRHDLYTNLRCGMAHVIRPQADIAFTHRRESQEEKTSHLQIVAGTGKLVLVSEDLYEDFATAAGHLRDRMGRREFAKKPTDLYVSVGLPPHLTGRP
jgi:hypothetical protein